ncbi:MAG: hypothetical protein ACLP01_20200 [Solirubrobacteraceae bacterium]
MTDTLDEFVQELTARWTAAKIGQDAPDVPEHHVLQIAILANP